MATANQVSYPTQYNQSWSFWNVGERASMQISTDCLVTVHNWTWSLIPTSLSFKCDRQANCIEADVFDVFMKAIRGKAHEDMIENLACSHQEVTGGCGNQRNYLSECRCEVLNRRSSPQIRYNYENHVIGEILRIVKTQDIQNFKLNLAIFCSGGLLGEEILLFRLFNSLRAIDARGTINLFLIDLCYQQAIKASSVYHSKMANKQSATFDEACGGQKSLEQFLIEICKCMPPSIHIEGTVFGSSETYIERAKSDASFKHHLIIGADIEKANYHMGKTAQEAGFGTAKPIALVKTDQPLVCQLDPLGNLENCYIPFKPEQGPAQPTHKGGGCVIV